jgi:putative polyhydroxyalkanoate system protein
VADLHIHRTHAHGFKKIRKIAFAWAELAEQEFGLSCVYQEGPVEDEVIFTRSGVKGRLLATHDTLEIKVELSLVLRGFKSTVEAEILKNLDLLLVPTPVKKVKAASHAKRG